MVLSLHLSSGPMPAKYHVRWATRAFVMHALNVLAQSSFYGDRTGGGLSVFIHFLRQAGHQKLIINSRLATENDQEWFSFLFCQQSSFIKVLNTENNIGSAQLNIRYP